MNQTISTVQPLYLIDGENRRPATDDEDSDLERENKCAGDAFKNQDRRAQANQPVPKYAVSAVGTRITSVPPSNKRSSISTQAIGTTAHESMTNTWQAPANAAHKTAGGLPTRQAEHTHMLPVTHSPAGAQPTTMRTTAAATTGAAATRIPSTTGAAATRIPSTTHRVATGTPSTHMAAANTTTTTTATATPTTDLKSPKSGMGNTITALYNTKIGTAMTAAVGSAVAKAGTVAASVKETVAGAHTAAPPSGAATVGMHSINGSLRGSIGEASIDMYTGQPSRATLAESPLLHLQEDFRCIKEMSHSMKRKVSQSLTYDNMWRMGGMVWSGFFFMGGGNSVTSKRRLLRPPRRGSNNNGIGEPSKQPSGGGMSVI